MDELIHKGHRQRMRRKFSEFGARVFDTYELLEMLLYKTVPVKDTNPISKKLLMRFGSLDGVLSAEVEELMTVDGVGEKTAKMIKTVGEALDICCNGENDSLDSDDCFENYDVLGEYIVSCFDDREDLVQILLSFDNSMRLIGIDEVYSFDYSSGATLPKNYINSAIKRQASVVVIAHNHPYGPLCPTEGDRETNNFVNSALLNIGVVLLEHYIVSGKRYVGFMNHLMSAFAQRPALEKFYESKRFSKND